MKFYHRIAGAKFYMADGREVSFAGGVVDTDTITDLESKSMLENELRKIADSPASQIYTDKAIPDRAETQVHAEILAAAEHSSDSVNKTSGGVTVAVPQPQSVPPVLNPKAAAGASGAMAAKIEEARLAVAATGVANTGNAGVHTGSAHTPKKTP